MTAGNLSPYPHLDPDQASYLIRILHYAYPGLFLTYFVGTLCCTRWLQYQSNESAVQGWRLSFLLTTSGILVTYIAQSSSLLVHSLVEVGWWPADDVVVYNISSILVWGVLQISLLRRPESNWSPYWGAWLIGLASELFLGLLTITTGNEAAGIFENVHLCMQYLRTALLLVLPYLAWRLRSMKPADVSNNNDDLTPLLSQSEGATEYGAIADAAEEEAEESRRRYEQRVKESLEKNGWWGYMKTYKILWQYIWPSKDRSLQFTIAAVAALTFLQRWTNILESLQTGRITDQLASGTGHFPWTAVLLYFLYHWLNSEGGISFLRSYLKLPVEQYSYRAITTAGFNHVLSLSSDFHTSKRTTDVYTAVTQARVVNFILDAILYRVFPIVMDAFVALGYFYITFGLYTALVVMIVSTAYLCVMIILGKRSAAIRRRWLKLYRKEANVMWEAMSCWETVIYFDRAAHEQSRFSDVLGSMLSLEWRYRMVSNLASVFEYLTLTAGLLFISFLAIHQIAMGKRKIGDYVTSVSFWSSITGSLQSVSNLHGHLWDMIINTERLLELLNTQPSVASKPGALDLVIGNGEIEFKDVSFAYDARKGAINGISFIAPGGKVTALVGESGGGKSTTLKLLFRFYDPTEGSINIDDQDIRDVTLSSLRNQIGVVPQEPKLFNDTIMNNLRYACLEATDEEIYSACQMAAIHDKILTFPDGYLSKCGEGGVKLSGGEKQRIAIARAILKNPKIVLLDEATSSVDIATECLIQGALQKLCAGRTTFVIAHRLSTIMNADQILVIGDGKITERGNHDDLMSLQGKYFELWTGPWNKRVDEVSMIKTSPLSENSQESEVPKQVDSQSPIAVVRYNTDEHKPKTSKTFTSPLSIKFVPLTTKPTELHQAHNYIKLPVSASVPNTSFLGQPEKENLGPLKISRLESFLKPEAKEFIPAHIENSPLFTNSMAPTIQDIAPGPLICAQLAVSEHVSFVEENAATHNTTQNSNQSVADEAQEHKHRRRRHRRRSRSSRSPSGSDVPTTGYYSSNNPYRENANLGPSLSDARISERDISFISNEENYCLNERKSQSDLVYDRAVKDLETLCTVTLAPSHDATPRISLRETAPNVPAPGKRMRNSREGRGNFSRWKPHSQGRYLLGTGSSDGYGAISGTTQPGSESKSLSCPPSNATEKNKDDSK